VRRSEQGRKVSLALFILGGWRSGCQLQQRTGKVRQSLNFGSASIEQGWRGMPLLDQAKERVGLFPRASDLPNDIFLGKQSADFVALGTICSKTLKRKCNIDAAKEWRSIIKLGKLPSRALEV
jgi:hypothetical protein